MNRILTALLLLGPLLAANASTPEQRLTIRNDDFRSTLLVRDGRIRAVSLYDNATASELLAPDGEPLFEFSVNGRSVSSDMPLWRYVSTAEQRLANDGRIETYTFEGSGALQGLLLLLDRHYFPSGAFLRERLRLRSKREGAFRLTNVGGRNHFIFPRYTLADAAGGTALTEMRIGTYGGEILPGYDPARTEDRRPERNLASCHMFHPDVIRHRLSGDTCCEVKGPFLLIPTRRHRLLTSYEHASQDRTYMRSTQQAIDAALTDAAQGVKGDSDTVTDDDLWFISTGVRQHGDRRTLFGRIRRGGYLDGEVIPADRCYETVWSTISILSENQEPADAIREYLLHRITDHAASRETRFYYNTWGMQRDASPHMRETFTEQRIAREIALAAETGVDLFIFDDGWQQTLGDWRPHGERLPRGLRPLVDSLRCKGITPGIWLSLLGIDPSTERARQHPGWIIRDRQGVPYAAQWNFPACDLVGGFYDCILSDLKRLADMGIRYFKWDAVNTFNSAQPGLDHGDATHSRRERIDRYNYLLPFYVTRLMRELRAYCPDAVVEIDLTEPERSLIGLMPLQEGKFFWMNNGASAYGDYSAYRTKSIRQSINATAGLLPPELLTYAVYPHNKAPFCTQRYNVNTVLQAGHGFWGDLTATTAADRSYIREQTGKARRVLRHVAGRPLSITGRVGASPELYIQAAPEKGYALFTAFSGSPVAHTAYIALDTAQVLGVLNHAFSTDSGGVRLDLQFAAPDDTREAFVLGNNGTGVRILSSTGWLDALSADTHSLHVRSGSATELHIALPAEARNATSDLPAERLSDGTWRLRLDAGAETTIRWR
ncbi:alpha-galactosidase [Alistipes sp.]|uniref:alpha-galactosidase n=1 Tax=Alistipes sp. TaxID=1872444 RepID=UPI003AEFDFA3